MRGVPSVFILIVLRCLEDIVWRRRATARRYDRFGLLDQVVVHVRLGRLGNLNGVTFGITVDFEATLQVWALKTRMLTSTRASALGSAGESLGSCPMGTIY